MTHAFPFQSSCSHYFASSTSKTEPYWLSFFCLELNWPSSQCWIHFLIKFYLRCSNSWTKVLCDPALPHLLAVSFIAPLIAYIHCLHCFLALASTRCALYYLMSFYTRVLLPEILYSLYVIPTHPSRPRCNVISSVKSPLILSSTVNNSLLCFPIALSLYTTNIVLSVQFFCLSVFVLS